MNRMGVRVVGVLVAGLMIGATACGSSGSSDAADSEKVTATVSDSGDGTASEDLKNLDDALGQLSGDAGDCLRTGMAFFALSLAPLGFMSGASQEELDQLKADTEELAGDIPSEIKDDFDTYAAGIQAYADAMQGVNFEDILDPAVQQKLEDASAMLDTPEMQQASDNIEKYFDETCPNLSGDSSS